MILDDLITILGFEAPDNNVIDGYKKKIEETTQSILKLSVLTIGAAGSLLFLTKSATTTVSKIGGFAKTFGENLESLQEWMFAAERFGSSTEALKSSIVSLNDRLSQAARNAGNSTEVLSRLGISATKSNGEIKTGTEFLMELSDAFQLISKQEQVEFARKLGIDNTLLPLLQSGSKNIKHLREEAKAMGLIFGGDALESSGRFGAALGRLTHIVSGLQTKLFVKLSPTFSALIEQINAWYLANKELIEQGMDAFLISLRLFVMLLWVFLKSVVSTVNLLIKVFGGWARVIHLVTLALVVLLALKIATWANSLGIAILALASKFSFAAVAAWIFDAAMLALNASVLLIPAAIALAIAAVLLLFSEIRAFFEGGDSYIGDFLKFFQEKFPMAFKGLAAILKVALIPFKVLFGAVGLLIRGLIGLGKLLLLPFELFFKAVIGGFKLLVTAILAPFSLLGLLITGIEKLFKPILNADKILVSVFKKIGPAIFDAMFPLLGFVKAMVKLYGIAKKIFSMFVGDNEISANVTKNLNQAVQVEGASAGVLTRGDMPNHAGNNSFDNSQAINAQVIVQQGGGNGYQTGREIAQGLTNEARRLKRNAAGAVGY